MKTIEFEPVILVPFKFEGKTNKYKVKRLADSTIRKIQEDLKNNAPDGLKKLEDLEEEKTNIALSVDFLRKKLEKAETIDQIEKLEKVFKEERERLKQIDEEILQVDKETRDIEDKTLCLATAGDDNTVNFFKKVGEKYGWDHLSKMISLVFKEYDKDFLSV